MYMGLKRNVNCIPFGCGFRTTSIMKAYSFEPPFSSIYCYQLFISFGALFQSANGHLLSALICDRVVTERYIKQRLL